MKNIVTTFAAVLAAFTLAACGSSGGGESASESNSARPAPGKPATPTPATQSKEGVEAAERAIVKAYATKRWYNAYSLQSKRCRTITDFETFQGQMLMAFGMLPPDMDWTIESVTVHSISEDKKTAKAEVVIPDLNAAMGPSSTEGDRWVYEPKDGDVAQGWKLDDCEDAA
jgi:hypothetical protein